MTKRDFLLSSQSPTALSLQHCPRSHIATKTGFWECLNLKSRERTENLISVFAIYFWFQLRMLDQPLCLSISIDYFSFVKWYIYKIAIKQSYGLHCLVGKSVKLILLFLNL